MVHGGILAHPFLISNNRCLRHGLARRFDGFFLFNHLLHFVVAGEGGEVDGLDLGFLDDGGRAVAFY